MYMYIYIYILHSVHWGITNPLLIAKFPLKLVNSPSPPFFSDTPSILLSRELSPP